MGLDMYLSKEIYIGAQFKHNNIQGKIEITKDGKPIKINFNQVKSIKENAGYWRKANHIHKWFVDNCQDGEDDCRDAYVSEENLQRLLDVCKRIQENRDLAADLLPPANGFFFGSTDLDEGYFEDIADTIRFVEDILKDKEEGKDYLPYDVYYHSSW